MSLNDLSPHISENYDDMVEKGESETENVIKEKFPDVNKGTISATKRGNFGVKV